jgi:hypothetical protein
MTGWCVAANIVVVVLGVITTTASSWPRPPVALAALAVVLASIYSGLGLVSGRVLHVVHHVDEGVCHLARHLPPRVDQVVSPYLFRGEIFQIMVWIIDSDVFPTACVQKILQVAAIENGVYIED